MIDGNQIYLYSSFTSFTTYGFVSFIINFKNPSTVGFYEGYLISLRNNQTGEIYC